MQSRLPAVRRGLRYESITVYKLAAGKLPVWGFLRYRGNFGAVTKARGKQNEKDAADEHRCAGRGH